MAVDRHRRPYIDIRNWKGLVTKSSKDVLSPEDLVVSENVDHFRVYGAIAKQRGSSRILSSQYTENSTAMPMSWIGMYKAADLSGAILRHILVAAGTTLKKISGTSLANVPNTSTATTTTTGRTSGLFHTYDQLDRFLLITNVNPDKVGEGDQLLKYDGGKFSNWGLEPPGAQGGTQESSLVSPYGVQEPFDDTAWTAYQCTLATDTVNTFDGTSLKLTTSNTGFYSGDRFFITKTPDAQFFVIGNGDTVRRTTDFIADRLSVYLYIPIGTLDDINQTYVDPNSQIPIAFSGFFGTNATNYWRFDLRKGDLVEGWNKINFDFSTAPDGPMAFPTSDDRPVGRTVGAFNPITDQVNYIKFEVFPAATAPGAFSVYLDRLISVDEGAPVTSSVAQLGGTFTGAYQWKVAFRTKYGHLSNTGPASASLTVTNTGGFYLEEIPISEDHQVVARELYRTVANGTVFLKVDEINDNTTRDYLDRIADGSLSEVTAPQAGDFSDDNTIPPKAGIVKVWKKTVFMAGDPQNPTTLYFSDDAEPESFPLINTFELDDKITAIYETYSGLVVETETGKWQVLGDNPDFAVDKIIEGIGCVGRRAAGVARLYGYAVDREGMRLFDLSDTAKISEPIRDKYDDELDKENIELIHTVHSKKVNTILELNPDDTGAYTSIFQYQYGVDDVRTGWWAELAPPASLNFLDAEEIEDLNGDVRVYIGGNDGMVYEILTTSSKDWTIADGTTSAVTTTFQSPYLRLGAFGADAAEAVTGAVTPVFLEIRADGDATTWTATIDMADGPDQTTPSSTVDIDFDFAAGRSLLRIPVKFGTAVKRDYLRLTLTNTDENVETAITAIRLYFSVSEGPIPITS